MTRRRWVAGALASRMLLAMPREGLGRTDAPADKLRPEHEEYMRLAIEAARNNPRAPFGAVVVDRKTRQIMGQGFNKSSENPVWHGEIDAMNRCVADHPHPDWKHWTLYTTAEPCAMCQSAILWAGMPLVVYGSSIPYLRELGWGQISLRAKEVARAASFAVTEVLGGVLESECNALFQASPISKHRDAR